MVNLKSSIQQLYGHHHDLINYLCHKWSVWRNQNPILFSFMTFHWVCKSNTIGAIVYRNYFPIPITWVHLRFLVIFLFLDLFCVVSVDPLLYFSFWTLYCRFLFIEIRLLNTHVISSKLFERAFHQWFTTSCPAANFKNISYVILWIYVSTFKGSYIQWWQQSHHCQQNEKHLT